MAEYMDYPPRKIIAMVNTVSRTKCSKASPPGYAHPATAVRCAVHPRSRSRMSCTRSGVKPSKPTTTPENFSVPALAQEMHKIIAKNGRSSELWLVVNMYLRLKDFIGPLKMAPMGINLMKTGRMSLKKEKIKNQTVSCST